MKKFFDCGIDLGTTNSAIARLKNGKIEVLKNPIGQHEILPSVVAFKKSRVVVGYKAKELMEKDSENVAGLFKRKMGTSEMISIGSIEKDLSPVALSSYVLKELKNFVYDGDQPEAVIITIPASFDTVQSNATKEAGFMAAFKEVRLLQEPVAAALSFVNSGAEIPEAEELSKWLVYDFGGGTFDVAIVAIQGEEMTIIDHQGDNYLGGHDFDLALLEKVIIPKIKSSGEFNCDILKEMRSASGKYNKLYYELLNKAEEVKVQLSGVTVAEIEFEIEDDRGEVLDLYFDISREQFESAILNYVDRSVDLVETLLESNTLSKEELKSILMIGGSTYVPLVRNRLKDRLSIDIDFSVDPTTAVAIGAAYYASTQYYHEQIEEHASLLDTKRTPIEVKTAYQSSSKLLKEYFTAIHNEVRDDLQYRITRLDGGFDSGLLPFKKRIEELLPLVEDQPNVFSFKVYDAQNTPIDTNVGSIEIAQGKFTVLGQTLPADICLELDDLDDTATVLELVFEKNAMLPLKKTITKQINTTLKADSDRAIYINILEGSQSASPASNKPIGAIEIKGQQLERDLIKDTDLEITIAMDQSRTLTVQVYVVMTDQEFEETFSPTERQVFVSKLSEEIYQVILLTRDELNAREGDEDFELAAGLSALEQDLLKLYNNVLELPEDDVSDAKFQYEDKKRALSASLDGLIRTSKLSKVLHAYFEAKKAVKSALERHPVEKHSQQFEKIVSLEKQMINGGNKGKIKSTTEQLENLWHKMNIDNPDYLSSIFYSYKFYDGVYREPKRANKLIIQGEQSIENKRFTELKSILIQLDDLLPEKDRDNDHFKGTGLS